ncbi:opioid growth factor receptor-like protein 1 isoform X2 [Carcharodon carcharias]|uniref:opioid growth factor receptor-like protein 1 isoform X2 n=1 Tax=Carcharodon carcharias TaxID=13397 RepID=UPI001B7EF241|nr:opioid growth factor receptor-like protein 1 isoform X2 [Carcharodon carcharias]
MLSHSLPLGCKVSVIPLLLSESSTPSKLHQENPVAQEHLCFWSAPHPPRCLTLIWKMLGGEEYDSTWAESEEEPEPEPELEPEPDSDSATPAPAPKPKEKGLQSWTAKNRQETEPRLTEKRYHPKYDMPYRWRNWRAAKDLQRYRHGYPDLDDKVKNNDNINFKFYMNKKPSQPDEWTIDAMFTKLKGNYEQLERNHSYIQWLFPLREPGMNWYAKELTSHEIELFKESKDAKKRLIEAYKMMLDFYGIELVNQETGMVKRAPHWRQQFRNLNLRMHNNLRITRILKCLGEMGFEHLQPPLVKFFLRVTLIEQQLPNVRESVLDYFLYTIRSKSERRKLILYAQKHYKPLSEFVWGPPKGMENRFSHILNELEKEEEETVNEESSDEGTLAKDKESSCLSSETDEGRSSKQRRLMKQRSLDLREKSANCVEDTEKGSEDHIETKKLEVATSLEEYSAEEKSNVDEKSPVSEDKSNQKGNVGKQAVCVEEDPTEDIDPSTERLVEGDEVPKNCQNKSEKIEGDLKIQLVDSGATCRKEKESKEKLLSREAEPFISEEDKPVTEGKVVDKTTEEVEPGCLIVEADNPATEESKTGNPATREPDKTIKPQPFTTLEDIPATEDSKAWDITKEKLDEVAKSQLVITEKDKSPKEEGTTRIMVIEQSKVSTELEIHEGQSKSVSERKIQSSTEGESECMEVMETQEVGLGHPTEDVKYPGGKGVEMEIETNKPCEVEGDVEMEDGQ